MRRRFEASVLLHSKASFQPHGSTSFQVFLAFEGLHGNIIFFVLAHSERKLFKGNDRQGECEQSSTYVRTYVRIMYVHHKLLMTHVHPHTYCMYLHNIQ